MEDDVRKDEVLMSLVYRARWDPKFKRRARADLEGTLIDDYRYELSDEELEACRRFWEVIEGPPRLSDEELDKKLATLADPITDAHLSQYPQGV
jgi:hypothetical protein